jgi:3-deoxy-manno-octulosonate cytidylyltransferase (CMP-KDO synthetase)
MISNSVFSTVAVIPAHLASVRFPGKILFEIHGLPMIEHVRRRALMTSSLDRVIVATCDEEVASVIRGFGGEVVMTGNTHRNGTTRVAEASQHLDCSHVILLQGDEPLLLPRHVDSIIEAMRQDPNILAWNATGTLENPDELERHSFVKCAVSPTGRILCCFRRSPFFTSFNKQKSFVRKILGIIAYRKDFLHGLVNFHSTPIEEHEFIEQMRIIENGYHLGSVPVKPSLPSVNEPNEVSIVLDTLDNNQEQKLLLQKVLAVY